MSVTWANVQDMFEETIGDTTQAYFSDAVQERMANNVLKKMSEAAEYRDVEQTGNLVVGIAAYGLSGPFDVWRVEVDDLPMKKITKSQLRAHDANWQSRTGTPEYYLTDESLLDLGGRVVRLYPEPNSILGYRIYGHGVPVEVDNDNSSYKIHVPEWSAYTVLFGMLERAFKADTKIHNPETSAVFGRFFADALHRLRARSFSKLNKSWGRSSDKMPRSFFDNLAELTGS